MSQDSLTFSEQERRFFANPGILLPGERWWRRRQLALEQAGYALRPRYRPDWIPSWNGTKKDYEDFEDGQISMYAGAALDATRASDGAHVMLKKVFPDQGTYELNITQQFSSEPLVSDPRNRCVRLLDLVELPDGTKFLVLPLLRPWNNPPFQTIGEVVAFFGQILGAVEFMHEQNIAHRDCTNNNIMYDPASMYPVPFHPIKRSRRRDWKGRVSHYTRTQRPPKYYLIDFGLSRYYDPKKGPALDMPILAGDKSPPENRDLSKPCDPFATDVYYLGNLIRVHFVSKCRGFEFLEQLVADMCHDEPSKRPKIGEAISRFKEIQDGLSTWKLRSRVVDKTEFAIVGVFRGAGHLYRTIRDVVARNVAIPDT